MENRENCKGKRKAPKWRLQLKVQQIKFLPGKVEATLSTAAHGKCLQPQNCLLNRSENIE